MKQIPIDSYVKNDRSYGAVTRNTIFAGPRRRIRITNIPCIGRWWNTSIIFHRTYRETAFDFKKRTSPDRWQHTRDE